MNGVEMLRAVLARNRTAVHRLVDGTITYGSLREVLAELDRLRAERDELILRRDETIAMCEQLRADLARKNALLLSMAKQEEEDEALLKRALEALLLCEKESLGIGTLSNTISFLCKRLGEDEMVTDSAAIETAFARDDEQGKEFT